MTSKPVGLRPAYPIRTERLDLRPHRRGDLEDLFAFHSLPEVVRYVPWPVRDREQTAAALEVKLGQGVLTEPGQWLVLAVELRESATVIGEVLLKWASSADRQGELGFAFHSAYHGRGLAAEAAAAVLTVGFDELDLHRIHAVCLVGNTSSARLLERLGMRLEGHLLHSVLFKGEWADQLVYSMRADEWRHRHDLRGEMPSSEDPAAAPDSAPVSSAIDVDRASIAGIVATFFAAFTSGPECAARLDALQNLFVTGALIVRTCGQEPAFYSVEEFIAPRQALLSGGALTDFHEWELTGRTDVFGDIAQHVCSYAKAGVQDGKPFTAQGVKMLQFVRTPVGWQIGAAVWDDERDGLAVDAIESLGAAWNLS